MKVAAWQAPITATESIGLALQHLTEQVRACEDVGAFVLCCPEAILGGLADYRGGKSAIPTDCIASVLAPLASPTVTCIVGCGDSMLPLSSVARLLMLN